MSSNASIRSLIQSIARQPNVETYARICVVESLNESQRTCTCSPITGGANISGVQLQSQTGLSEGTINFPVVGSRVIVVFIEGNHTGYIIGCSEIDSIELRGSQHDGLVKVKELTERLNAIESAVNTIKSAINGAVVGVADGGATFKTNIGLALTASGNFPVAITKKAQIENDKIKHG